jgi:cyclopropane-fatty-acyl-phospholipid synthase
LKPGGIAVFQVITIPDERYETYRKRSDWIQKHIFPGGMLPSLGILKEAIGKTQQARGESQARSGSGRATHENLEKKTS